MKTFPILYKRTSTGATQQWVVEAVDNGYLVCCGQVGGKIKESALHACEAKNVGRANETSISQQALIEADAEWTKKCKTGYTPDLDKIDTLSFKKPMKGDKYVDRRNEVVFPVIVQDKLNGIRCQSDANRSYSTGGETFHTIPHIREALRPLFEKYPNAFIDGELFNYTLRKNLNRLIKLVSVVIQPKDLTPELLEDSKYIVELHVFDCYGIDGVTMEDDYETRHNALCAAINDLIPEDCVQWVPYWKAFTEEDLMRQFKATEARGGEGVMIRNGSCKFQHKRVPYLLKLKHFYDAEYEIVDIQQGNGDWEGCAKRIILRLPSPATNANRDETFASNIDGSMEDLRKMYNDRHKVIGLNATCEYQQLSEYGIPQLPWVRSIRNYE